MIIDVHTHIGRSGRKRTGSLTPTELVLKMDGWGVAKSCVLPLADCPEGWYLRSTTEDVLRGCNLFPDRLIPFCLIDPRFGDNSPNTDFSGLLAEYKERGCKGVGEMVAHLDFDDPRVVNLCRQAGEAGFPVLFHLCVTGGRDYGLMADDEFTQLESVLQQVPGTTFIGHGPHFWARILVDVPEDEREPDGPTVREGALPRLMARYPNLYGDLSAGSGYNGITRNPEYGLEFLDRFQDKLLFGSDMIRRDLTEEHLPMITYIQRVHDEGKLADAAFHKIVCSNITELLGL